MILLNAEGKVLLRRPMSSRPEEQLDTNGFQKENQPDMIATPARLASEIKMIIKEKS